MIEDLFNKILILVLSLHSAVFGSDIIFMSEHEYVPVNFTPYNASKTSIGINLYESSYSQYEFTGYNWHLY